MSIYKSYCNEFIDQYSVDLMKFKRVGHRLEPSKEVESYREEMKNAEFIIKNLTNAVKFKIPACDQLLPEDENPLLMARQFVEEANLPYPIIAMEMDVGVAGAAQNCESILLVKQEEDSISIFTLIKADDWTIMHQNEGDLPVHIELNRKTFQAKMVGFDFGDISDQKRGEITNWCLGVPLRSVLNLWCILSCSNTRIDDHPEKPSRLKNDMRKRKKKLPFFEFKILTIESNKPQQGSSSGKGSHASPRVHLRRGHIRKLPTKNVWVNACVVGDKAKGVIQKDYLVKGGSGD